MNVMHSTMASRNGLTENVICQTLTIQILIMTTLLVSTICSRYSLFLETLSLPIVEMALLRMVNVVMTAMTSKRTDAMPVSAKEVLRTSEVAVLVP